jgi:hemerythrin-like domain-containing protein
MHAIGNTSRRRFLTASGLAASAVAAAGSAALLPAARAATAAASEKETTANEDLMREHGVLRRALLVYQLAAHRLHIEPNAIAPDALNQTARLFRQFGEDYHERQLEEAYIFPAVRKAAPAQGTLVDTLLAQHRRGREITDYVLAATGNGRIGADPQLLGSAMNAMVLMYQQHAAREDTLLFPAWKQALSDRQYAEMGDRFEEIEKRTFGGDGFDDAVKRIAAVEKTLGWDNLATFTAPPPKLMAQAAAPATGWTDPDKAGTVAPPRTQPVTPR